MATSEQIELILSDLQAFYSGEYNERQLDMLVRLFAHDEVKVLERARDDLCASLKWLPKPSEIREAVERVRQNNGRGVVAEQSEPARPFWAAMGMINGALSGIVSEEQLENSWEYQAWRRQSAAHPADCPCRPCRGLPLRQITPEEDAALKALAAYGPDEEAWTQQSSSDLSSSRASHYATPIPHLAGAGSGSISHG